MDNPKCTYENRKRKQREFLNSWKTAYTWLENDTAIPAMCCTVCRLFPTRTDKSSAFYIGTNSYRIDSIKSHSSSLPHVACVAAKKRADNPGTGLMDIHIRRVNQEANSKMAKIIRTAYHVIKQDLPLSTFEHLLLLQEVNGVDIGASYRTDVACRRWVFQINLHKLMFAY